MYSGDAQGSTCILLFRDLFFFSVCAPSSPELQNFNPVKTFMLVSRVKSIVDPGWSVNIGCHTLTRYTTSCYVLTSVKTLVRIQKLFKISIETYRKGLKSHTKVGGDLFPYSHLIKLVEPEVPWFIGHHLKLYIRSTPSILF